MVDTNALIGKEFAGVTLLSVHGHGHTGVVFVGFQKSLRRKVAIKLVPKDKVTAQSFQDEAEVVAVLNHPNIVTIFDVGETDEFLHISMQLIEGSSLQELIERAAKNPIRHKRTIPADTGINIIIDILDALRYAHGEGVIHQDVKPGNILVERSSGRPFLADFGIARTELTEESKYVHGTPLYMAPEQARGEHTDARADIYATGAVLWEIMAGALPAPALPAIKIVSMKAKQPELFFQKSPLECGTKIDSELSMIINKATAANKDFRYNDCAEFRDDLKKYAEKNFRVLY